MGRYAVNAEQKATGSVSTPIEMANYLAAQMLEISPPSTKKEIRIMDPAIGDGVLVIALLRALQDLGISNVTVVGFDTDEYATDAAEKRIFSEFPSVKLQVKNIDFVEYMTSRTDAECDCQNIDYLIANPPYIRTQLMGSEKTQQIAQMLNLTGRIDIYYAFLLLSKQVLSNEGLAGFITSNKFMTIKSGTEVRRFLCNDVNVRKIVDFGDTRLFSAAVLPCILLFDNTAFRGEKALFHSIYEGKEVTAPKQARSFFDAVEKAGNYCIDGKYYTVRTGVLATNDSTDIWTLETVDSAEWLHVVDSHTWRRFSSLGKIRVGIKTTADKVFIGNDWRTRVKGSLPELLRPLITHRNAGQIIPGNGELWEVLYTHEVKNGKREAIDLSKYPYSYQYLLKYREKLGSRKYIREAKRNWYEIWVPHDPDGWTHRKIVFRDISEEPMFWLDSTGAVVNGDCYWIDIDSSIDEDIVMLALSVANSKFIETYYDIKFNTKLYSGKRRYITQYVEQFPLPDPKRAESCELIDLVRQIVAKGTMSNDDKMRMNKLVIEAFS